MTILFIIVAPNKYPEKIHTTSPFLPALEKVLQQKAGEKPKKNKWKNRRTGKRENLVSSVEGGRSCAVDARKAAPHTSYLLSQFQRVGLKQTGKPKAINK